LDDGTGTVPVVSNTVTAAYRMRLLLLWLAGWLPTPPLTRIIVPVGEKEKGKGKGKGKGKEKKKEKRKKEKKSQLMVHVLGYSLWASTISVLEYRTRAPLTLSPVL